MWQYASAMSSLYRQYRPQVFESVIGQDHIRDTLVNALQKDRVAHAYLFSGPRGTGKTTLARLFARAVNCPHRSSSQNPCNKCELCVEIGDGRSVDVFEIDAASNRGIDEIRELRDKIGFAPARAKFKVYIIDEVHMLTKEAFNALLKTLEEPPPHAIFVLATTELHKVPDTIISRCQRYAFHRAPNEALLSLLRDVAKAEKLQIADDGLLAVVERSEGSYRDALTLLGNIATHEGDLDATAVRRLLGLPPASLVETVLRLVVEGAGDELVQAIKAFINDGGDIAVLTKALAESCKQDILRPRRTPIPTAELTRILETLLAALARSRSSADPAAVLIAAILGLSFKNTPAGVKEAVSPAVLNDVARVEKPIETVAAVDAVAPTPPAAQAVEASGDGAFWDRFLQGIKSHNHALYMVVRAARLEGLDDDKLTVAVKFRFYVDRLQELRNRKMIETVAAEIAGRPLRLVAVIRGDLDQNLGQGEDAGSDELVRTVVDVFELEESK
jgi:DNA polymerase-3 subunit gamma/tau